MSIAGHVPRAMLSRYSHVRMEAKRLALVEIAARQRAAGEQRKKEGERREQAAVAAVSKRSRSGRSDQRYAPQNPPMKSLGLSLLVSPEAASVI